MILPKDIEMVTQKIIELEKPQKVYLFGSYARGEAKEGSDLDLLIIKETDIPKPQRNRAIRKELAKMPFGKDIIIYTPDEFNRWLEVPSSFCAIVRNEGKLLYES